MGINIEWGSGRMEEENRKSGRGKAKKQSKEKKMRKKRLTKKGIGENNEHEK